MATKPKANPKPNPKAKANPAAKKGGKLTRKNMLEVSVDRDFEGEVPATLRYAILSSPRSGSTLLARMLRETGLAGDPLEYFNPRLLVAERVRTQNPKLNLRQFLEVMEKRRTSPNGIFGIKMHFSQLMRVYGSKTPGAPRPNPGVGAQLLKRHDKLIWIRRRSKLRQAISQRIALATQAWSSEERAAGEKKLSIHPLAVLTSLRAVAAEDRYWERLIGLHKLDVLEVWYEDLVADYEGQCRRVLAHLGIDGDVAAVPAPPIERQHGEVNDQLYKAVMDYIA